MRRLTAGRFASEIDRLQDKLDEMVVLYQQVVRDLPERRDFESHDAGRISGIGHGDSTGGIVLQHESTQKKLRRASAKVEGWIDAADKVLDDLMSFYDPQILDSLRSYTTPDREAVDAQNRARRDRDQRILQEKRQRLESRLRRLREAG